MSKKRMAGEKLDERFGDGFSDRVSPDGMQDPTNAGSYSKKELLAEFRGRGDGVNIDEGEGNLVEKYQGLADSGTTFNKRAQSYLEGHGVNFGSNDDPVVDTPDVVIDNPVVTPSDPTPAPPFPSAGPIQTINPGNPGDVDGTNVNINQDNDIYTNINGNDNVVTNNQDNSISIGGYGEKSDSSDFKNMWMNNFFN